MLVENQTVLGVPTEKGFYLTTAMADHAIDWLREQRAQSPDQPFFLYFATGASHAPHHVPKEWADRYAGRFDAGWDALARGDLRPPEEAGRDPRRREADAAPRRLPGLGRAVARAEEALRPTDGGVCRLPGAHRSRDRTRGRGDRRVGRRRRHARPLHLRRQRRLDGGHRDGDLQRAHRAQRHPAHRRAAARGDPRLRRPRCLGRSAHRSALRGGVGLGRQHALPVGQAGGVASRGHAQRDGRRVAEADRRRGRSAQPVHARDRRHAHHPRGGGDRAAGHGGRRRADADARDQLRLHLRRRRGARAPHAAVLRDHRQPRALQGRLDVELPHRPHPLALRPADARAAGARCTGIPSDDPCELYDLGRDFSQSDEPRGGASRQDARSRSAVLGRRGEVPGAAALRWHQLCVGDAAGVGPPAQAHRPAARRAERLARHDPADLQPLVLDHGRSRRRSATGASVRSATGPTA